MLWRSPGARELNKKVQDAETRATNAINNLVTNGLTGMGITTPVTASAPVFYKRFAGRECRVYWDTRNGSCACKICSGNGEPDDGGDHFSGNIS